jgi:DnaK suppressor protein
MEKEKLEYFRATLTEQLASLVENAARTRVGISGDTEFFADIIDQASFEYERSTQLRIRDRESYLIRKIRHALQNMEDGTFGICEMCGNEISLARLMARPVTQHCIQCKTKMENRERALGL